VTAMIDVSDGLASDVRRLAEESRVLIEVELERVPLDEGVEEVARLTGHTAQELAVTAGEDYELLVTANSADRDRVEQAALAAGAPVSWIGEVRPGEGVSLRGESGDPLSLEGWDHFAKRTSTRHR
jgi:thiamine-monophosphate kinase